jgi:hypothetical protein
MEGCLPSHTPPHLQSYVAHRSSASTLLLISLKSARSGCALWSSGSSVGYSAPEMSGQQSDVQGTMARLLLAHERELKEIKQALEIDVLVVDSATKTAMQTAVTNGEPRGQRVRAFKALIPLLTREQVAGAGRFADAESSPPRQAEACGAVGRQAVEVHMLHGNGGSHEPPRGHQRHVGARRNRGGHDPSPLLRGGPLAEQLEQHIYGPGTADGKGKGKGKSKGRGKSKGNGTGAGNGGGRNNGGADALAAAVGSLALGGANSASSAGGAAPAAPTPMAVDSSTTKREGDAGAESAAKRQSPPR